MRKFDLFLLIMVSLVVSLLLGACASTTPDPTQAPVPTGTIAPSPIPEPIVLIDGLGREFILAEPAQKIVSLAPSNTEILFAIGAGAQVVGRDSFSDHPEEAQGVRDIGGGFGELDTETILALEPDLVLAASLTPPEQIQALEELEITIFALANPSDLEGMFENLRLAGQITGHQTQAEALIADLQTRVKDVEGKVATIEEKPLVFYELDSTEPNAPWTSGPGTFIDKLITQAGGTNLGVVLDGEWAQISIEELIIQNPDIIILGDYTWGGVTPTDVAARAGWEGLAAVRNDQVYTIDDNLISRPGPRMVEGLEELAKRFHPELFQ